MLLEHVDAPDIELRWSTEDAEAIFSYTLRGDEAMRRTTVIDGDYAGPPAPCNLMCRPELDAGFPLLYERTERVCRETNPAFTTARSSVGRPWYERCTRISRTVSFPAGCCASL